MTILNYLTIGVIFSFLVELLLNKLNNNPQIKIMNINWGWGERTTAIIIWPLALIIFIIYFFKAIFR